MIPDVKNPVENSCDDCCTAKYEFRFTTAYDPSDPWDVCFKQCVERNGVCPSKLTAALDQQRQQQVPVQPAQAPTQYLAPGLVLPVTGPVTVGPRLQVQPAPGTTTVAALPAGRYVQELKLPGAQSVFPQGSKVMWSQTTRSQATELLIGLGVIAAVAVGGYYLFAYRKKAKARAASPNRCRRVRRNRAGGGHAYRGGRA